MNSIKKKYPKIILLIFISGLISLSTFAQKIELKKGKKHSVLWIGIECNISLINKQKYEGMITHIDSLSITIKSNDTNVERIYLNDIKYVKRKFHLWLYGRWASLITYKKEYNFTKWSYKYKPK